MCSDRVRKILEKHWGILGLDESLEGLVPSRPLITFRKGRSLRDRLVHSHFLEAKDNKTWLDRKPMGCFRCSDCSFCKYIVQSKNFQSATSGCIYSIRDFINCKSVGLIYMATCPCPRNYVGKTTRQLRKRVGEHLGNIRRGEDTPLATHMQIFHPGQEKNLSFIGLEIVRKSPRGGNFDNKLLRKEAQWIFRIDSQSPKGLNEALNFGCFI